MSRVHIVWFRRDLSLHDHAALAAAAMSAHQDGGAILPIYILEPDYWQIPEHSRRQYDFVVDCLADLDEALRARCTRLHVLKGEAVTVLAQLHRKHGIASLHGQIEPEQAWTTARTQAVHKWCRDAGIPFREQDGGGGLRWADYVDARPQRAPRILRASKLSVGVWPELSDLDLADTPCLQRPRGGRREAGRILRALTEIGSAQDTASLNGADSAQSLFAQLSPHLSFGTVSLREAWQAAEMARTTYQRSGRDDIASAFRKIQSALKWQFQASRKTIASPRVAQADHLSFEHQDAWSEGATGYPLIDASQRALTTTGYLSWRLRSPVLAFAAGVLEMGYERPAQILARRLVDYDPALHAALIAFLATETEPSDPVQVARDLDPDGVFVREWVPELAALPTEYLHAPWRAPAHVLVEAGITLGATYPRRIAKAAPTRPRSERQNFIPRARRSSQTQAASVFPYRRQSAAGQPANREPNQLSFDLQETVPAPPHTH